MVPTPDLLRAVRDWSGGEDRGRTGDSEPRLPLRWLRRVHQLRCVGSKTLRGMYACVSSTVTFTEVISCGNSCLYSGRHGNCITRERLAMSALAARFVYNQYVLIPFGLVPVHEASLH